MFRMDVVNLEQLIQGLGRLAEDIAEVATEAALSEADLELAMTQELVPVDTGQLKASGRVEGPDVNADQAIVAIAYGGPAGSTPDQTENVDYAIPVHERLDVHHPHGQAKYVETVVREELATGRSAQRMGAEILGRLALGRLPRWTTQPRARTGRWIVRAQED